ncbi:MAG: AAA family ATPase [Bacteroidales bacterium]|nr:AAA family ATPase [Bacteroidales bacterium]
MLEEHIHSILTKSFLYKPTECQKKLLRTLAGFVVSSTNRDILLVNGYAGTGKTTVISTFVNALKSDKIKSFLLAPTGRAAKVIMNYSNHPAFTIHKKIYRQKSSKDGFGEFVLDVNLHKNTFFIVDEASMISNTSGEFSIFGSGNLLNDLIDYVYSGNNCKLILIGDIAQLPPVGLELSPALDEEVLKKYGLKTEYVQLTEVIRQNKESGILMNATRLREILNQSNFNIKFSLKGFTDIERLSGNEFIEILSDSIYKSGLNDVVVICRSNKRANLYNQGIRNRILNKEEEISTGDLLMVVKNNYYWSDNLEIDFIANGDIIEIVKIHSFNELYGLRFADITARFIDFNNIETRLLIILDTLNIESASLPNETNKELFYKIAEDYQEIKTKKKRYQAVKEDKYFNALQVKFAYAITCHKAQGGQWKYVFIDQGYLSNEMINREYIRWLYTAFTRSIKKLYLINFNNNFFKD